jgi:hypothetical protein
MRYLVPALVFLLAPLPALAQSVTVLEAPTIFYKYGTAGAPGSDAAGCGTAPSNACSTCRFLWNRLLNEYDLNGQSVLIRFSGGVHNDTCALSGRPRGQQSARQIEFIGNMSSPASTEIAPAVGDAFSATFGAMYAVGGLMARHTLSGQGVFTTGWGGDIQLLGEIISLGDTGPRPDEANDLSASDGGMIEFQTPDTVPDRFGVQADGNYWFDGPGQCAFDAGNLGVIQANGNGQPDFFTFHWNGQRYSLATACANAAGLVQIQNVTHVGTVNAAQQHIVTCGIIDTAGSGFPHTSAGPAPSCPLFN